MLTIAAQTANLIHIRVTFIVATRYLSMPFCILSVSSFVASASIMRLPEMGGQDLLKEGGDFGRSQSLVQVLFVEIRRKKDNLPSNKPQ